MCAAFTFRRHNEPSECFFSALKVGVFRCLHLDAAVYMARSVGLARRTFLRSSLNYLCLSYLLLRHATQFPAHLEIARKTFRPTSSMVTGVPISPGRCSLPTLKASSSATGPSARATGMPPWPCLVSKGVCLSSMLMLALLVTFKRR